jgi:hypothetical protein
VSFLGVDVKAFLQALVIVVVMSILLIEGGGGIYAIQKCGGINDCGDDPAVGIVMVIYSAISMVVSILVGMIYFFWKRRGK